MLLKRVVVREEKRVVHVSKRVRVSAVLGEWWRMVGWSDLVILSKRVEESTPLVSSKWVVNSVHRVFVSEARQHLGKAFSNPSAKGPLSVSRNYMGIARRSRA